MTPREPSCSAIVRVWQHGDTMIGSILAIPDDGRRSVRQQIVGYDDLLAWFTSWLADLADDR